MNPEYKDIPFIGPPNGYTHIASSKWYIAVHDTENTATDTQEATYAERRTDSVSSHYYVDKDSVTQGLRTEYRAWHAGSEFGNLRAIAYEITGKSVWTAVQWKANVAWSKLARQIARDCRKWDIPARLLTVSQMKAKNVRGIVTHDLMRQAWGQTDHTDPGKRFPIGLLVTQVAAALTTISGRTVTVTAALPTLWDLCAHYLGSGARWLEAWGAVQNVALRQLRGGPTHLVAGDRVWLPGK